jgi:repressor LexA
MARPVLKTLTSAQKRVLEALALLEKRGEPGFVSTLVKALGLKAESSLTQTLQRMERNGFLLLAGGGARGRQRLVQLSSKGRLQVDAPGAGNSLLLPLLGRIPAGPLEEALEQEGEAVSVSELLRARPGDFLLEVKGDSMTGDGIFEGDKVLLRPGVRLESGEIAAVVVGTDHETTLKRVHFFPGGAGSPSGEEVLLRASNPAYPDRRFPAGEIRVAGVFRGLIRPQHNRMPAL